MFWVFVCSCVLAWILYKYSRLISLYRACRKLSRHYRGRISKLHPLFLLLFFPLKGADIKMSFKSKDVLVKIIPLKKKTSVRFVSDSLIELIRYNSPIQYRGKRVTPVMGGEVRTKRRKKRFSFPADAKSLKLILFTSNPSEMLVYDTERETNFIIGDGETAFAFHVAGYSFLNGWIERNVFD